MVAGRLGPGDAPIATSGKRSLADAYPSQFKRSQKKLALIAPQAIDKLWELACDPTVDALARVAALRDLIRYMHSPAARLMELKSEQHQSVEVLIRQVAAPRVLPLELPALPSAADAVSSEQVGD